MKCKNCKQCGYWFRPDYLTCPVCEHKAASKPVLEMVRNYNKRVRIVV